MAKKRIYDNSWVGLGGQVYKTQFAVQEPRHGHPRRFCAECRQLLPCWFATGYPDVPICHACVKRLDLTPRGSAWKLASSPWHP